MTSFDITMALVNAGCDLRKLDPEIIKLIEAAGSSSSETDHQSAATNNLSYGKIAELIIKLKSIIDCARMDFLLDYTMKNDSSNCKRVMNEFVKFDLYRYPSTTYDTIQELASLIASLD